VTKAVTEAGTNSQLPPERLSVISKHLAARVPNERIVAKFVEEWGMSERQIHRYIAECRRVFRERWDRALNDHAADLMATLDQAVELAFATRQPAVAIAAVREIAKLKGVHAPTTPAQVQAVQMVLASGNSDAKGIEEKRAQEADLFDRLQDLYERQKALTGRKSSTPPVPREVDGKTVIDV
jgi:hypothetical protein